MENTAKQWRCPSCLATNEIDENICKCGALKPENAAVIQDNNEHHSKDNSGEIIFYFIIASLASLLFTWFITPSDSNAGTGVIVWLIFTAAFFFALYFSDIVATKEAEKTKKLLLSRKSRMSQECENALNLIYSYDYLYYFAIYADICKVGTGGIVKTLSNKDILWVELREDSNVLLQKSTSNTVKRALVGGVLAGGAGAVVGGLSGNTKSSKIVGKIDIVIGVDNKKEPALYTNLFLRNANAKTKEAKKEEDARYGLISEYARKVVDALTSIIESNDNTISVETNTSSISDEILKAKSLLDSGIITNGDFESIKNKLLNK